MNLFEVACEISRRLISIFLRDESGRRPVYGGTQKFQTDPHWREYILFYQIACEIIRPANSCAGAVPASVDRNEDCRRGDLP
jgi:hypothetical protein